jgi:hypothetical protein
MHRGLILSSNERESRLNEQKTVYCVEQGGALGALWPVSAPKPLFNFLVFAGPSSIFLRRDSFHQRFSDTISLAWRCWCSIQLFLRIQTWLILYVSNTGVGRQNKSGGNKRLTSILEGFELTRRPRSLHMFCHIHRTHNWRSLRSL